MSRDAFVEREKDNVLRLAVVVISLGRTIRVSGNQRDENAGARVSIGSNSGELSSILKLLSVSELIEDPKEELGV